MNPLRNIIRLERETVSGSFLVRMSRRGQRIEKWFVDSDFGGKRKCLLAAKAFRDRMESELPRYTVSEMSKKPRSNNTSGVVGIRLVEEVDSRWKSQPKYAFWVAQWTDATGKRRTARFSVQKYGKQKAYKMAVDARKNGLESATQTS